MLQGSVVGVVRGVRSLQDSVRRIGFQMCCRFGGQKCSKCVQRDLEKEKNKAKRKKKKIGAFKKPPRRQSAETDFQMKKRFIFRKGRSAKIAGGRKGGTYENSEGQV